MASVELDIYLRNSVLLVAAFFGIIYLIVYNIKESGINFNPFSKNNSNADKNLKYQSINHTDDWHGEYSQSYLIHFDEAHIVWEINLFTSRMSQKEKKFTSYNNFPWFEFSKSQTVTERIMSPILRKLYIKYKEKFEKVHPIHVLRVPRESIHFYTWLQNETHTHSAVFNFLEESLYIATQLNVFPSLSIIWDDVISLEVIYPKNQTSLKLLEEFEQIFGIDCTSDETRVSLKLWIAFSIEKTPPSLKEKNKKKLKSYKLNVRAS